MIRLGKLGFAVLFCGMLAGCGSETREGLVTAVIDRMKLAASEVDNITSQVKKATDLTEKEGKKLDLTEAGKAAEKLKETGVKIVEIRQSIDRQRSSITDDDKKTYAENQRKAINDAFETLLKRKVELRDALAAAEKYGKVQVDELRKKITDAESPFEAQAR